MVSVGWQYFVLVNGIMGELPWWYLSEKLYLYFGFFHWTVGESSDSCSKR